MKARSFIWFLIVLAGLSLSGKTGGRVYAQDTVARPAEAGQAIRAGDQYLDGRTAALGHYVRHTAHIQERLLIRLSHAEHNLTGLAASEDSFGKGPYDRHGISFDSLQKLAADPSSLYNKGSPKVNRLMDSLKGIEAFIGQQSGRLQQAANLTGTAGLPGDYSAKLRQLRQQLNAQEQLQELIEQRSRELRQRFPGKNIPALNRITRQIAIAKAKGQSWKQLADDPDAAEEKAYEYLQGIQGFNNYLNNDNNAFGGLGNRPSIADLQRMGYQTKGMVGQALQQRFGDNLDKAQQQISQQLSAYQKELNKATGKVSEAGSLFADTKNSATDLGHSLQHIQKPAFKNPMRGVPFLLRWQPRYDLQTTRALDSRPAMLSFSAGLAYKQTPKTKDGPERSGGYRYG
jgi:hypothetical protein